MSAFSKALRAPLDKPLTPPFALGVQTALQRALKLALNFLNTPTLDPRITFTRASSGTHFDSTGRLVTKGNDAARFDYDPAVPAGVTGGELVTTATTPLLGVGTAANTPNLSVAVTVGKTYLVSYTVNQSAGACAGILGGTSSGFTTHSGVVNASFTAYIRALSTSALVFFSNNAVGTISNISVQEVTFTPRGLLIEEQRTNLCLYSSVYNTTWTVGAGVSLTANATVAPDGTTTAYRITGTAATVGLRQGGTIAAVQYAVSCYLKADSLNYGWIGCFDGVSDFGVMYSLTGSGAVVGNRSGGGAITSSGITAVGNGWFRCNFTFTSGGTGGALYTFQIGGSAAGNLNFATAWTGSIFAWGYQHEAGAFATSYIPTTTATATRAADSASMTGTNFSSWFNASAGTFVVEGDLQQKAVQQSAITVDDTTMNNRIELAASGIWKGRLQVVSGGVSQADVNNVGAVIAANTPYKFAATYAASDFQACLGGTLGTAVLSGTVPAVTRTVIGSRSDNVTQYNGHLRSLRYYNTRLPNATLQSLTA